MTQPTEPDLREPGLRLELKYCEACGGLQVRPVGSGQVYCLRCETRQADEQIPLAQPPRRARRRPRLPRGIVPDLHGCAAPRLYSFAVEVRA